jgi:5-carboxymethyl-2-hydroxymuconate isomerase
VGPGPHRGGRPRARRVREETALDVVLGYTCINDVSARDLQFSDKQYVRGKSLDTFCPMGPAVVTADEIPDPGALAIRSFRNGQPMQDSSTAQLIFSVPALIAFCSRAFTLEPGDVIATGTPAGVGWYRDPKVLMCDGDVMTVEIERIGRLENRCREMSAT